MTDDLQASLEELQSRAAYQEDNIDALNRTVAEQHQQIYRLQKDLDLLREVIRELKDSASAVSTDMGVEPPPPHY